LTFLFCCVAGTAAFQCDNKYISAGCFRDEVLELCGSPSMSDTWQEERLVDLYIRDSGQLAGARRVLVTIDRWTYNFGPTHHTQTLTFENAKLISIKSGRLGY
jgi:outer membrane protein assembly factor BamE (lipoprotein component of BamABCDE complex)